MMQPDLVAAQAGTLREWADLWDRDAEQGDGKGEVAFLLRRAASLAERIATGEPPAPPEEPALPEPETAEEPREG